MRNEDIAFNLFSFVVSHFPFPPPSHFSFYKIMFEKLKLMFHGAGLVIKHGTLIGNLLSAWNKYPGLDNSDKLRWWLRPLLVDAQALAFLTKTQVDDAIVLVALRIIDNERAWAAVHAMALLAQDGFTFRDGVLIPESTAYQTNMAELNEAAQEIFPGCPVLAHAAIGLLLLLLQRKIK